MNRVDGKVALVSGGTRGIGAATCELLAQAGARVVVTGRQEALGQQVLERIAALGGEAVWEPLDVTVEAEWARVVDAAVERFGALHVLVNNAGVVLQKRIEDMDVADLRRIAATNLEGVFLGTKHAIRAMKAPAVRDNGGGSIVNVASVSGLVGMGFSTAYSMSKGGVRAFTRSAALEVADLRYNIRVNAVYPTFIETDMADELMAGYAAMARSSDEAQVRQTLARLHPLRRFGRPVDVARAILFLASDDSAYMTGAELVVDGGFTAR